MGSPDGAHWIVTSEACRFPVGMLGPPVVPFYPFFGGRLPLLK